MNANTTTTGTTASELRAQRDALRYTGKAPNGDALTGAAKYALTAQLTAALEAAEVAEGTITVTSPKCWNPRRIGGAFAQ